MDQPIATKPCKIDITINAGDEPFEWSIYQGELNLPVHGRTVGTAIVPEIREDAAAKEIAKALREIADGFEKGGEPCS